MANELYPKLNNALRLGRTLALSSLAFAPLALPASAQDYRPPEQRTPSKSDNSDVLKGVGSALLVAWLLYTLHKDATDCAKRDATGYCVKHN